MTRLRSAAVLLLFVTLDAAALTLTATPEKGCRQFIQTAEVLHVLGCGHVIPAASTEGYAWLESEERISAFTVDLARHRTADRLPVPWRASGLATMPPLDGATAIEWHSGETRREERGVSPVFRRRALPGATTRLPAGKVIALAWRGKELIAVSRPLLVGPRGVAAGEWHPAAQDHAQVVAQLARPAGDAASDLRAAVLAGGVLRAPELVVDGGEQLLGVWYALPAGAAKLQVESASLHLAPAELRLRGARVELVQGELRRLPTLTVRAGGNADDEWPELKVTVREHGTKALLRELVALPGKDVEATLLQPALVDVTLAVDQWQFTHPVDLSSGEDALVDFALSPFRIRGRLVRGSHGARGTIDFLSSGRSARAESDEDGRFELDLWKPSRYVYNVRLAGAPAGSEPYSSTLVLRRAEELEIRIPSSELRVRVADEETRVPLGGATVVFKTEWEDPREGKRGFATRVVTDDNGEAVLPPLNAGSVQVTVLADGYASSGKRTVAIADDEQQRLDVALRRDRRSTVELLLHDGRPAGGAEAIALVDGVAADWTGRADAQGRLEVPDRFRSAYLLVRHQEAASAVRRWDDVLLASGPLRLEPPAPELRLRVDGEKSAAIVFWLDGLRLDPGAAAFAAWAVPHSDGAGMWTARNLPRAGLRMLAVSGAQRELRSGALDALFTEVRFPWSGTVAVRLFP